MYRKLLFRRLTAGLLAVIVLTAACGCGKNQGEDSSSAAFSETEKTEDSSILDFFKGKDEASSKEKTMRVGADLYGFVEVPEDWKEYTDSQVTAVSGRAVKQFCSADGSLIVTLNYADGSQTDAQAAATSCWVQMEQDGAQNIQGATVELAGCKAYQVYGYYAGDDVMLVIWVFSDKEGRLHYISAEGPLDTVMDCVKLVEDSYSIE